MADWVRQGTGTAPSSFDAELVGEYALDNGTAPPDFDASAVTGIRCEWTITGSGFTDDSWDNVAGVAVVAGVTDTEVSQHPGNGGTSLQNTTSDSDHTDSTGIPTGLTTADWEAAYVRGDGITVPNEWVLWNKVKSPDGSTLTVSALTVTITYTPSAGSTIDLSGSGANASDGAGSLAPIRGLSGSGANAADGTGDIPVTRGLTGSGANASAGSGVLTTGGQATFPAAPTGLTAQAVSGSQIDLSWDAVSGATGYDIERDGVVIVTDHPITTYEDTGLEGSTEYTYRVRAVQVAFTEPVWAIDGERWTLNGVNTDVWGVRVASGSQTQDLTDELIAAMPDYAAHGTNAITVFYQGSRGMNSDPFENPAGDTVEIDSGHQARMDQIIDKAEELGMMVVVGLFYQNVSPYNLSSVEQVRNALRAVTDAMSTRTNVVINPCNEQNSTGWGAFQTATGWDWNDEARVIEACQVVHTQNADQIVGGGGFAIPNNNIIIASSDVDCLLFDTFAWTDDSTEETTDHYEQNWDAPKPILNVETYGGITKTDAEGGDLDDIGVFFDGATDRRLDYQGEVDRAAPHPSLGLFFHASNWYQNVQGSGIHFELGTPGEGTVADPGVRWWFEYVRDNG